MCETGWVNAGIFVEFLRRLMHGRTQPLCLIVDGHPVHRSREVQRFIEQSGGRLRLFVLPSYSPDLNPDERVWSQTRHHRTGSFAIERPDDLKREVVGILGSPQELLGPIRSLFQHPRRRYVS